MEGTDKTEIYSKSVNFFDDLKIIAFVVDILKGCVISTIKVFTTSLIICINIDDEDREIAALTVAGVVLFVIIYGKAADKCFLDRKKTETPTDNKSCELFWYYLSNLLMGSAVICYFIGDNLRNFYKFEERPKSFRIASQILLIAGVLGFRYLPIFKGYVYKYYNKEVDSKTTKDPKSIENCIVKMKDFAESNDKITKNIIRKCIALVPEADAIYTIFENIFTSCSESQLGATLTATLAIPIILTPYIWIQILAILSNVNSKCRKWSITIIMTLVSFFLVLSFTLSDNQKVLNCLGVTKCTRINDMNELNTLNVTCNTTYIGDDLFNRRSSEIVIGTECPNNNYTRMGLNLFQLVTVLILGIVAFACSRAVKKDEGKGG